MLGGAATSTPNFDHATSRLDLEFEIVNELSPFSELAIPKGRYPSGVDVVLTPVSNPQLFYFIFYF
jgi:hypothetical protein